MKSIIKSLALAAALTLTAGTAMAAEEAMKDCCAKCECCKDMKKPDAEAPAGAEHKH